MKILGVVVTYYPDIIQTTINIKQYIDYIDYLIIWENTPHTESFKYKITIPEYENKIIFMGTSKNEFISFALNQAAEYGVRNGYSHLLTMDQDSFFEIGHFARYIKLIAKRKNEVAIYGPNPNYKEKNDVGEFIETNHLITSGSIVDCRVFEKIGFYREDYKIDCLDYEFCLRAAKNNIKSYIITFILLKQDFGHQKKSKFGYYTSNYSPTRLYFIARNNFKLHFDFPEFINKTAVINMIYKIIIKILLSESNKLNKLIAVFKGINDGLLKKT